MDDHGVYQLHAAQSGTHWRASRESDPWFLRAMFANNFKTPMGTWCVYGLFSAGIFAYASQHPILVEGTPYFDVLKYAAFSGRGISVVAELWMC